MTAPSTVIEPAHARGEFAARRGSAPLRRVVLFNVKYSPNLGDGLLSECLERELARSLPGCEVTSVDLAGRTAYPSAHGKARGMVMGLLERCPPMLRLRLAAALLRLLVALRLGRHYRKGAAGAGAIVVGGGNLLTDVDLNFPIKIAGALARVSGLPVAVYGVGVAPRWSSAGSAIFARAFAGTRLTWASVRDPLSQQAWNTHFSGRDIRPAEVVVDPGVLACLHYPRAHRDEGQRRVGFCVTDPLAIRYHADRSAADVLEDWYPQALRSLVERGFEVALFTNGSPEDREYLHERFHTWIRRAKGPVTLARSFETPADIAALVSGCDAIVGHRMHACIAAYSFGVPAVGLNWDVKLNSFFDLSARSAHMLDPARVPPELLGQRVRAAIADGFDPGPLVARARREIATFAALLQERA